jgi:hypothetical protein
MNKKYVGSNQRNPGSTTGAYKPMGDGAEQKHSSVGPEREMRRGIVKTEAGARAKHRAVDTKDHPALKGNTTRG